MTTNTQDWPRAYLLQIYDAAIKQGFIWIEPITLEDAISLRQRLYRLRRRADKSMAPYILPDYHLVTIGQWQSAHGGRLPIIFNRNPSGAALPSIVAGDPSELDEAFTIPGLPTVEPLDPEALLSNITVTDLTLEPEEVSGFVDDLIKSAKKKAKGTPEQ